MGPFRNNFMLSITVTLTLLFMGYASPVPAQCDEDNLTDGRGVYVREVHIYYECEYLKYENYPGAEYLGIYPKRLDFCNDSDTECCETCASILSCQDVRLWVAESPFDCTDLLNASKIDYYGIYKHRQWICTWPTTQCCETCKIVNSKVGVSTTDIPTPESAFNAIGTQTPSSSAAALTATTTTAAPAASVTTSPPPTVAVRTTTTTLTPAALSTTTTATTYVPVVVINTNPDELHDCIDSHVMVDKMPYDCRELVNVNSDIYNDRIPLCESIDTFCCLTCRDVQKEKSPNVIKYSEENTIDINGNVVASNEPASITKIQDTDKETIKLANGKPVMMTNVVKIILEQLRYIEENRAKITNVMLSVLQRYIGNTQDGDRE